MIKARGVILIILFIFQSVFSLKAKDYLIHVTAPGHAGEQISAFTYEEYFTENLNFKEAKFLDEHAKATFTVPSSENELVLLRIGAVNTQFFLGNSPEYHVTFNTDKAVKPLKFTNDNWAPISFITIDSSDVNISMEKLNAYHNSFFKHNYTDIYQAITSPNSHVKKDIQASANVDMVREDNDSTTWNTAGLKSRIEQKYQTGLNALGVLINEDGFLKSSAEYMKMELSGLLGRNENEMYNTYLKGKHFPRNPEYVNAHKTYHAHSIEDVYSSDYLNYFKKHLYNLHLDSVLMYTDSALVNHSTQNLEYDLLAGIDKALDLPNISNRDVTLLLELIIRKGRSENQIVARNLKRKYQVGKEGYEVPECEFLTPMEELVSTEQWEGKLVYVNFFTTWHSESEGYMEKIKQLHSKYGLQVHFVSVCMDESWDDYKDYLANHYKYGWDIYFGSTDKLLKEKLGVVTLPYQLLISPEGVVLKDYTPEPAHVEPVLKHALAR